MRHERKLLLCLRMECVVPANIAAFLHAIDIIVEQGEGTTTVSWGVPLAEQR